ncbi:response regulator transcription factor [Brucellaceae bacterium D45D]
MELAKFSGLILKLTATAVELLPAEYNARLATILGEAVQFDAAWWGWSSFPIGRSMIVNGRTHCLPANFETAFKTVAQFDPFIRRGRNLRDFAMVLSPQLESVGDEYRAFTQRFGIVAMMNGHCRLEHSSAYNFFMSLYRVTDKRPFQKADADTFHIILRHLEQVLSLSLRMELKARAGVNGAVALLDETTQIVRATPDFETILQTEGLPKRQKTSILHRLIRYGGQWKGSKVALVAEAYAPGLTFIHATQANFWHKLSPQERRVADLLLAGRSAREIADVHQVSINTIRNQISTIYRKLGVDGKIALSQRLSIKI